MENNRMKRLFISLLLLLTPFALIQGQDKRKRGQDSRYVDDKPKIMEELDQLKKQKDKDYAEFLRNKTKFMKKMSWWINHPNTSLPESYGGYYLDRGELKEPTRKGVRLKKVDFLGEAVASAISQNRDSGKNCDIEFVMSLIDQGGDPSKKPELLPCDEAHWHNLELLTANQVAEKETLDTEKPSACAQRIYNYFKDLQEERAK